MIFHTKEKRQYVLQEKKKRESHQPKNKKISKSVLNVKNNLIEKFDFLSTKRNILWFLAVETVLFYHTADSS